jgi:Spy/CpxP family protein refolding chaperone
VLRQARPSKPVSPEIAAPNPSLFANLCERSAVRRHLTWQRFPIADQPDRVVARPLSQPGNPIAESLELKTSETIAMKYRKHWKLLAAAVLTLSTADVTAQDQGRARAFRTGGESPNDPTYLLASESVQKELSLTDSQKTSIQKLRDAESGAHPFLRGLIGLSQDEIQKKLEQHAKENRDRVSKILTPQQTARLNEINIQVAGVAALSFDDVAEKLELTAEQKEKLANLADEARHKQTELNAANNGQSLDDVKRTRAREDYKQKLNEVTAERKNQAIALLTDEQQAAFKKLQGKKFDTSSIQPNRRSFTRRGRIEAPVSGSSN